MWKVIRRAQGISPNEDPFAAETNEQKFRRNQHCILMHETKPQVPYMDPTTMTRAYGDLHYEKIRRWLLDDDPHLRLQAMDQLIELYAEKREHRAKSLSFNVLPILFSMLCTDSEEVLRERAALALEMLVQEPATQGRLVSVAQRDLKSGGAAAVAPRESLTDRSGDAATGDPLRRLLEVAFHDKSDRVVILALRVAAGCHAYVNHFALTQHLVDLGLVPAALALVESSLNPVVRAVACSALVNTFDVKEAHILFEQAEGMRVVSDAIQGAEDDMLVAEAAEVVSRAAEWPQGKRDAVRFGTMAALQPHMTSANLTVRVAVAAALAQITVWEPAKFQALETSALTDSIRQLLSTEDERDVIAHLATLVYHLAEHPGGRATLRPCKARLEELLGFADSEDISVRLALENGIGILSRK